jgi:Fe2+ or Zn2+ uptake regulation protein
MCHQCDYAYLLEKSGLGPTPKRLKVLEVSEVRFDGICKNCVRNERKPE